MSAWSSSNFVATLLLSLCVHSRSRALPGLCPAPESRTMGWHLHFTLAVVTGSLLCWGGAEGFMQGHIALSAVSMSAGTRTAGPHARELGLRQRGLQVCGISRRYRPRGILVVSSVQESQEAGDDDAVGIDEVEKPAVETPNAWPCGDKLDKAIITLSIPAIINFLVPPLLPPWRILISGIALRYSRAYWLPWPCRSCPSLVHVTHSGWAVWEMQ